MPKQENLVYCIAPKAGKLSYIGKTNDFKRRLRQHNQEIKGGARYTKRASGLWRPVFHVRGFKTAQHALQLEWRLHSNRVRIPRGFHNPFFGIPGRRAWAMYWAMRTDRFTTRAPLNAIMAYRVYWYSDVQCQAAMTLDWPDYVRHFNVKQA